jgi:uncharacterized repeat protein (TIGR03803 family)
VFRLYKTKSGVWEESVNYSFTSGTDGSYPVAPVIFDAKGNVYGTTLFGGSQGTGTVFELSRQTGEPGPWVESVLYDFLGSADGAFPVAAVVFDASGNLYGATPNGGESGGGTVFKLLPPASQGDPWTETILYSFQNLGDGGLPEGAVAFGPSGQLYGAAQSAGAYGGGVAFSVQP